MLIFVLHEYEDASGEGHKALQPSGIVELVFIGGGIVLKSAGIGARAKLYAQAFGNGCYSLPLIVMRFPTPQKHSMLSAI